VEFDQFWTGYPKRVAKKDAQKAWAKLSAGERAKALEALPTHIRYWDIKGTEKHYIPHPASWLNGARFEDELELTEHVPQKAVAWWATDDGVMKKAAEVGIRPRAGESMPEFKARVVEAVRRAA
jgi:hypothetical protein